MRVRVKGTRSVSERSACLSADSVRMGYVRVLSIYVRTIKVWRRRSRLAYTSSSTSWERQHLLKKK